MPKNKSLGTFITYSPQIKNSIYLEVGEEAKLLPDSAFTNSLCTRGYKPKSEKPSFFLVSLEKVQNYPQLVKWATLFRANPVFLLLQVNSLTLNSTLCFYNNEPSKNKHF